MKKTAQESLTAWILNTPPSDLGMTEFDSRTTLKFEALGITALGIVKWDNKTSQYAYNFIRQIDGAPVTIINSCLVLSFYDFRMVQYEIRKCLCISATKNIFLTSQPPIHKGDNIVPFRQNFP